MSYEPPTMSEKYYLATTAIQEIWDINSKLLLLGPWCLTTERNKRLLEHKDYTFIPSPWKSTIKIKEASYYCRRVYDELLPKLSESLNSLHGVSFPLKYWQILIGPWLLQFIEIIYDRFKRIESALVLFPDLYTKGLPNEKCEIASLDHYDFIVKVNNDYYNLKLFSLVAYELCPQKIIKIEIKSESKTYHKKEYNWKQKIYYYLKKLLLSKGNIVLADMYYLTLFDMFLIKIKSGINTVGFLEPILMEGHSLKNSPDFNLRQGLNLKWIDDRFQSFLYKILPHAIPLCYVENYRFYRDNINKRVGVRKIVGSATGWDSNELFKFFAAEAILRGAKSVSFQHAPGYNTMLITRTKTIALEKDIFYTWDRSLKENKKVKHFSSPKFSKIKDTYSTKSNKVIFVGTNMPKYLYQLSTSLMPDDMLKYFEDKNIFFKTLLDEIKDKILYRPYHYEYGWGELEIIEMACSKAKILNDGKLIDWMKMVKLVVIDHPHSSYLEALVINVPSVFYWDHEVFLMRPEAEPYFELLRKAGILYKDPMSAAEKVNEIRHDVQGWWQQPEVQKAKDEFCYQFARTSKNWRKEWVEFLKGLGDKN